MEDIEFQEYVHVTPRPGFSLNVSRRVPSLANQACQNLQKMFRTRIGKALNTRDVAELTCAVVLVAVTADILYTLCPRKRKTYGIAGSKFVLVNSALTHTIFVLLLLEFRTKAPGARTIAQLVGHRFGLVAHILTIIISLLTSLYTLTVNIIMLMCMHNFGLYVGNMGSLYKLLMCYNRPDHGLGHALAGGFDATILSDGLISLVRKSAHLVTYHAVRMLLDQALWETAIMLPPNHGVLGLLLATIMAFCVPFALSVVCGLSFSALKLAFLNAALFNATHRARGRRLLPLSH
ncbi:unnamed protein product [Taenia asiatica]|uniref:TLC domain-containing protein n=1 Tax=Taenia asiatica TaxID=60517 RepID=A0A0R3WDQ0_TAEAS|nr:unnamed protein product [Taenia asiatica]